MQLCSYSERLGKEEGEEKEISMSAGEKSERREHEHLPLLLDLSSSLFIMVSAMARTTMATMKNVERTLAM